MSDKLKRLLNNKEYLQQVKRESLRGPKGDKGDKGEPGRDGVDGKDGINGLNGKDGKDGLAGVNGKDGKNGRDGIDGRDGKDGKDAREIVSADVDSRGDLIIKYSDGKTHNAGHVRGRDGANGGGGGAIRKVNNREYKIVNADYTIRKTDYYIEVATQNITVTLSGEIIGREYEIINSSIGYITVSGNINNETFQTLAPDDAMKVVYNGTQWRVV